MSSHNGFHRFPPSDDLPAPAERPHSITSAAKETQHQQQLLDYQRLPIGLPHAIASAGLAGHDALRRRYCLQTRTTTHSRYEQTKHKASAHASHNKIDALNADEDTSLTMSHRRPSLMPNHPNTARISHDRIRTPSKPDAGPLKRGGVYIENAASLSDIIAQERHQNPLTTKRSERGGRSSSSKKTVQFEDKNHGIEMAELQRINININMRDVRAMELIDFDPDTTDTDTDGEGWETAVEDADHWNDADWCLVAIPGKVNGGEEVGAEGETGNEWCVV